MVTLLRPILLDIIPCMASKLDVTVACAIPRKNREKWANVFDKVIIGSSKAHNRVAAANTVLITAKETLDLTSGQG